MIGTYYPSLKIIHIKDMELKKSRVHTTSEKDNVWDAELRSWDIGRMGMWTPHFDWDLKRRNGFASKRLRDEIPKGSNIAVFGGRELRIPRLPSSQNVALLRYDHATFFSFHLWIDRKFFWRSFGESLARFGPELCTGGGGGGGSLLLFFFPLPKALRRRRFSTTTRNRNL